MPTARLALVDLAEAQSHAELRVNSNNALIDAAVAALGLSNTFTGANVFSGALSHTGGTIALGAAEFSGVIGGSSAGAGTALQMKSATVTPAANADVTLSAAEMSCPLLTIVAGAWAAGHNVIVPNGAGGVWEISNSTGFTLTVKTAAGTGINIANGRAAGVRSNGSNVRRRWADCDPTV